MIFSTNCKIQATDLKGGKRATSLRCGKITKLSAFGLQRNPAESN